MSSSSAMAEESASGRAGLWAASIGTTRGAAVADEATTLHPARRRGRRGVVPRAARAAQSTAGCLRWAAAFAPPSAAGGGGDDADA